MSSRTRHGDCCLDVCCACGLAVSAPQGMQPGRWPPPQTSREIYCEREDLEALKLLLNWSGSAKDRESWRDRIQPWTPPAALEMCK